MNALFSMQEQLHQQQALQDYWPQVNATLVAKMISEFAYEQAFPITPLTAPLSDSANGPSSDKASQNLPLLSLKLMSNVHYQFRGWKNIWGQYVISPESITRQAIDLTDLANNQSTIQYKSGILASQFMVDAMSELGMNEETWAEHLEDLNATLLGDCKLRQIRAGMSAKALATLSCDWQQCLFDGHPKFAFNKGRRGWGSDDLALFAPEASSAFQLYWIAVEKQQAEYAFSEYVDWQTLLDSALDSDAQVCINEAFVKQQLDPDNFLVLPVHPWQWNKKLSLLFIDEIANKSMIFLGELGDKFLPQLSIRTLTNITRPLGYDIKLPLTIMNTSCYRGIPGRYILAGPLASQWMDTIFKSDPTLIASGAEVLAEPASAFVGQKQYQQLSNAPYRYHELCGVIWRQATASKLKSGEQAILMAALMESDSAGNALIATYINGSNLNAEQWLTKMFEVVVIPFYHLLVKYGVSLIAHGQNVTLILKDNVPTRILLKDFQGDMRLVDREIEEQNNLPAAVKEVTTKLPERLIIHDLQTGHFVTVLRFISPLMVKLGVDEMTFYRLLAVQIQQYMNQHPALSERFKRFDLFKAKILRIGLNIAKFRHQTDSSQSRMLPDMHDLLDNPLYLALSTEDATLNS